MEGFCAPLRAQGWEIYNFNNISLYWIYHANNWGRNIILRVSVRPYGRRDWKYTISKILFCIGYIMPTLGGRILSTSQFLKSLYQVLCKNTAFMGCTVPSKKSIYHLYIRPTNRYIAYISSKHRCIPLNIIYTSLLMSPYQELFKNIAFHANPGKRTLLKGGGGGHCPE